jgi:hypothetical protein
MKTNGAEMWIWIGLILFVAFLLWYFLFYIKDDEGP